MCIRVQRIWLFFRKWRIQTLWWVQNWNLRHVYKIRFLIFRAFFCVWLQSLKKVLVWPLIFFFFYQNRCQKTQNFTLILNPLKKLLKNAPKKVKSKTSLTNMTKSEISAFFRHVFANNFFLGHFFKTFSTDSKSAWNSAFFYTFLIKKNIYIFLGHITTFFKLWLKMRRERLKKTENLFFYECVLEFNYATIKCGWDLA
jgi:hypothetical protein